MTEWILIGAVIITSHLQPVKKSGIQNENDCFELKQQIELNSRYSKLYCLKFTPESES